MNCQAIECKKEATHLSVERRGATAGEIFGDYARYLTCDFHAEKLHRSGVNWTAFRLSNHPDGQQVIIVATMGTEKQPTIAAERVRLEARQAVLACYSCHGTFNATEFDASTQLCPTCYDEAGWENEHSDTNGEHDGRAPVAACPTCAKGDYPKKSTV